MPASAAVQRLLDTSLSDSVFSRFLNPNSCSLKPTAATARRDNPYQPRFSLISRSFSFTFAKTNSAACPPLEYQPNERWLESPVRWCPQRDVPFPTGYLLADVVASVCPAFSVVFTVCQSTMPAEGMFLALHFVAQFTLQVIMNSEPSSTLLPNSKILINGSPVWKLVRQQSPRATGSQEISESINDFAHRIKLMSAARLFCGQERFKNFPFGIS